MRPPSALGLSGVRWDGLLQWQAGRPPRSVIPGCQTCRFVSLQRIPFVRGQSVGAPQCRNGPINCTAPWKMWCSFEPARRCRLGKGGRDRHGSQRPERLYSLRQQYLAKPTSQAPASLRKACPVSGATDRRRLVGAHPGCTWLRQGTSHR